MSHPDPPGTPASDADGGARSEAQPSEAQNREVQPSAERRGPGWIQKLLPWAITLACFAYLYLQINAQAGRQGQSAIPFLAEVFANVSWGRWLALMIPPTRQQLEAEML